MTTNKLDFRREDLNGTPIEIGPGSWVCGELHCPGGTANLKVRTMQKQIRLMIHFGSLDDCLSLNIVASSALSLD